jgi:hypothetical protein
MASQYHDFMESINKKNQAATDKIRYKGNKDYAAKIQGDSKTTESKGPCDMSQQKAKPGEWGQKNAAQSKAKPECLKQGSALELVKKTIDDMKKVKKPAKNIDTMVPPKTNKKTKLKESLSDQDVEAIADHMSDKLVGAVAAKVAHKLQGGSGKLQDMVQGDGQNIGQDVDEDVIDGEPDAIPAGEEGLEGSSVGPEDDSQEEAPKYPAKDMINTIGEEGDDESSETPEEENTEETPEEAPEETPDEGGEETSSDDEQGESQEHEDSETPEEEKAEDEGGASDEADTANGEEENAGEEDKSGESSEEMEDPRKQKLPQNIQKPKFESRKISLKKFLTLAESIKKHTKSDPYWVIYEHMKRYGFNSPGPKGAPSKALVSIIKEAYTKAKKNNANLPYLSEQQIVNYICNKEVVKGIELMTEKKTEVDEVETADVAALNTLQAKKKEAGVLPRTDAAMGKMQRAKMNPAQLRKAEALRALKSPAPAAKPSMIQRVKGFFGGNK